MTTHTLHLSEKGFAPNLPPLKIRELNWMGRTVKWFRDCREEGGIQRIIVLGLAIFTSIFLITSLVFCPIFLYGYKEFITQEERGRLDFWRVRLHQIATQNARFEFLRGRRTPLANTYLKLPETTRKRMIHDLNLNETEASRKTDHELLCMAATKHDHYLERYSLKIVSPRSLFFQIFSNKT